MVVDDIAVLYVVDNPDCNAVPPEGFAYQLNIPLPPPPPEATEAVGTCKPHCVDGVVVGAFGNSSTVTVTGPELAEHPLNVAVAV